ncbi:hypothetical protein TRICI_006476 [Trichomonascus ciferrii]|uniref:Peptidase A1 domain-containing protein n=1 Tax=Trichomonascus ciferrii TaxID=44093 RepID=A0A642UH43_9ASCO|nr:hypothetical protein TRICI_006476 [Trichomonascus ciferrii]
MVCLAFIAPLLVFVLAQSVHGSRSDVPEGAVQHELYSREHFLELGDEGGSMQKSKFRDVSKLNKREYGLGLEKRKSESIPVSPSYLYYLNISLGSPPQHFMVNLETKSSDVWVFDSSVKDCTRRLYVDESETCVYGNSFDTSKSRSFDSDHDMLFNKSYLDGSVVSGVYGKDTFKAGGITLKDFTFGRANHSTAAFVQGAIGLGFQGSEGVVDKPQYNDLLTSLTKAGYIYTSLASLFLNDKDQGSILFGAIDTEKFNDTLYVLPVGTLQNDDQYRYPFVQLTEVSVTNKDKHASINKKDMPVLLDPGNIMSFLPYDSIVAVATQLNAMYNVDLNLWMQSCKYKKLTGTVNFHFYDATIEVPVHKLLLPMYNNDTGKPLQFNDDEPACALAFEDSAIIGYSSLGSGVMSSIYTVFDRDNFQIGLAQAKENATKSNIQVIANNLTSHNRVEKVSNASGFAVDLDTPQETNSSKVDNGSPKLIISNGEIFTSQNGNGPNSVPHTGLPEPSDKPAKHPTGAKSLSTTLSTSLFVPLLFPLILILTLSL